jgi:hypothetical protein
LEFVEIDVEDSRVAGTPVSKTYRARILDWRMRAFAASKGEEENTMMSVFLLRPEWWGWESDCWLRDTEQRQNEKARRILPK